MNTNDRNLDDNQLFDSERVRQQPELFVDDLAHELLPEPQASVVRQWCETTEPGKRAWQQAMTRKSLLDSLAQQETQPKMVAKAMSKIDQRQQRRRKGWRVYRQSLIWVTAASILVIAGFNWYYYQLKPTPYDIYVVGQTGWMAGSPAAFQVLVRDRETGKRIDVPVRLSLLDRTNNRSVTLASYQSGNATPPFEVPDWFSGEYVLQVTADVKGSEETHSELIELTRPWKLLLTTDKPMYQPGQIVHLRTLVLRQPRLIPLDETPVTFRIRDPRGNTIFKQTKSSSEYGIAAVDCELATELNLGDYEVECEVEGVTSVRTIKIARYVLPKIQASIGFDRPFYSPSETATIRVDASYVFGKPLSGGKVRLFGEADGLGGLSASLGEGIEQEISSEGIAEFQITLPEIAVARPQDYGKARIRVIAEIEDSAGQKLVVAGSRIVTDQPILVDVIAESNELVAGVPNTLYISSVYADGRPAQTQVEIENRDDSFLDEPVQTNALGIAKIEVTPDQYSLYLDVTCRDEEGRVGTTKKHFGTQSDADAYLIRTDQVTYAGGETITLEARGQGDQPIFVDLLKSGQTVSTHRLDMSDGEGTLQVDLPPELFGTIRVESYRILISGIVHRQSQVIFVRQANELLIKTELDRETYRPGEQAKVRFRLTDQEGNPKPGALSVSIVDEALFALLQSEGTLAQTFFLLEQDLLEPILTVYPDWNPLDRSTDYVSTESDSVAEEERQSMLEARQLFERALFAWLSGNQGNDAGAAWRRGTSVDREPKQSELANSPYDVAQSNYQWKVQRAEYQRWRGLENVSRAWFGLGAVVFAALYGGFLFAFPRTAISIFGAGMFLSCAGFLLMKTDTLATRLFDGVDNMAGAIEDMAPGSEQLTEGESAAEGSNIPRVRERFPETLFWQAELITDDQGIAEIDLDLADSITTWRMTLSANDTLGNLGAQVDAINVFQEFQVDMDLPVRLKRGDEVEVPVVVYNFSDQNQSVELQIEEASWFERLNPEAGALNVDVAPGEVVSVNVPIRVMEFGQHSFLVTAIGSTESDAIRRSIEVIPNGKKQTKSVSGRIADSKSFELTPPQDFVEGSYSALLTLYPSTFSQLVEGLDGIFRRPYGCFEQTSSTTYPNVLALRYMLDHQLLVPQVEVEARKMVHLGYQRLLTFEVPSGGFDWYGRGKGKLALTAYGLLEFKDMAKFHEVDPYLIERTERWLLSQRKQNGSWDARGQQMAGIVKTDINKDERYEILLTAAIAWAVFEDDAYAQLSGTTADYLLGCDPNKIDDPYTLAMVINALAAMNQSADRIQPFTDALAELATITENGQQVHWEMPTDERSLFYGDGESAMIEATALATLGLTRSGQQLERVGPALEWLLTKQDAAGTWMTTQATVLALKALLESPDQSTTGGDPLTITVQVDGVDAGELVVEPDQFEVVQRLSLTEAISVSEPHLITFINSNSQSFAFRIDQIYYVDRPGEGSEQSESGFSIELDYDKTRLTIDETVTVKLVASNQSDLVAPMVMLDLPIPAGFKVDRERFDQAVESGEIGKYEITPTEIILYLRGLSPNEPFELEYVLKPSMLIKAEASAARIYEYYDPDREAWSGETRFEVEPEN